jgi:hypothetical protein
MYKPSQEALDMHAADVTLSDERGTLLDAARAADVALREAEARHAPVTELHQLAMDLDGALTDAMRAAFAAQRAEIGPRGYEDRIYFRQAKAKPAVHALTNEAERLLTLRENHRLNHIPEVPRVPIF